MHLIIYSGSHNINALGATKSIDSMLVTHIEKLNCDVTWVGRGSANYKNYHNLGQSRITEFFIKVINKAKRVLLKVSEGDVLYDEYLKYDKILAKRIRQGHIKVDSDTVLMGRNGMSLNVFKEVQSKGGKVILHSQWMHPKLQSSLLENEFNKIGLKNKPVSKKRLERQEQEFKFVDKIWCISNLVVDSYIRNGFDKKELLYLPLGVDYAKYNACYNPSITKKEFIILFVGNVNPEKGVHILMQSILQLGKKKITIIFNGAIPKYFENIFYQYADLLQKNGVKINISPGNPLENYSRASIFVLPSIHESFGLVVLEAMAAGLPIIVSDNVGAKDCVENGVNGVIFKSGDINELALTIDKFYSDKKLVFEMGKASSIISKEYDWGLISEKMFKALKGLMVEKA